MSADAVQVSAETVAELRMTSEMLNARQAALLLLLLLLL